MFFITRFNDSQLENHEAYVNINHCKLKPSSLEKAMMYCNSYMCM